MEASPPPPEGALLHRARESAEITIADAAKSAGITDTRWSQIERGHERRKGMDVPARAKAGTLARMARAIGIPPERLESEGRRPDAAEILREILRTEPAAVSLSGSGTLTVSADDEAMAREAEILFPGDRTKQAIWRTREPREVKLEIIALIDRKRGAAPPARDESEAGLAPPPIDAIAYAKSRDGHNMTIS
jgi:transcriptional regulator with XRE-family HTH domain